MNKRLEEKFNELENSRNLLLGRLSRVDEKILIIPPKEKKWSIAQIFFHLNQAETLSIIYVRKKMQGLPNIENTGIVARLKLILAKIILWQPIPYQAPAVLGEVPEKINYSEIVDKWNETRNNLKQLLNDIPEDALTKELFKQPTAGRLNIYQMLDFMQSHFERHKKQVEKIIKMKLK